MQTPSAGMNTEKGSVAKVVLFPGDPLRAKALAERYLESPVCFNTVRNMFGYTGTYKGRRISVMGSGMGVPSATLYAHDLYHFFDVESIIRIGTTGSVSPKVGVRDIIIAMSASTNSNFSIQYDFPGLLAPTADFELLLTAVSCAANRKLPVHVGSVFTADQFYNESPQINEKCRDLGILSIEMETAGIYWEAMRARKRALSILTVSDNIFTHEEISAEERQESLREMMELSLETAWNFAE